MDIISYYPTARKVSIDTNICASLSLVLPVQHLANKPQYQPSFSSYSHFLYNCELSISFLCHLFVAESGRSDCWLLRSRICLACVSCNFSTIAEALRWPSLCMYTVIIQTCLEIMLYLYMIFLIPPVGSMCLLGRCKITDNLYNVFICRWREITLKNKYSLIHSFTRLSEYISVNLGWIRQRQNRQVDTGETQPA